MVFANLGNRCERVCKWLNTWNFLFAVQVDSQVLAETMERLERLEAHLNEEKQRRKHTEEQLNKLKHHVEIKKRPSDGDGGVAVLASGARDRDGDLRSFPGYINEKVRAHRGLYWPRINCYSYSATLLCMLQILQPTRW